MRSFADTLPTLRDSQAQSAPPQAGFEAEAILKVLGAGQRPDGRREEPDVGGNRHAAATQKAGTASVSYRPELAPASPAPNIGEAALSRGPMPAPRGAGSAPTRSVKNAIPAIDTDIADGAASAVDKARLEARAAAELEIAAAAEKAREDAEAAAEVRLEAERTRWAEDVAASLSTQLDQAIQALHDRIADAAAAALAPVLEEEMTTKAVERFSDRIDTLLSRESPARAVVVKGPQPLIDALDGLRTGKSPSVQLVVSEDAELTARINDTSLRTTIGMWAGTLTTSSGPRNVTK
ncbi:hypothetical protein RDV64_17180 [Acuticoccus sp. MNP-M23]|uniref:hypothetical protein n=1 Tax=Acuticoccus sp. MNP-M23 TaxID=3072793 RepID=UPI0028165E97|nr:hypothetical protein [Acuticoccus sp. MNP-M23]WMS41786.1 hypothetical protein RDV64_17180 [Acuticoccus sp. MNP-M23]